MIYIAQTTLNSKGGLIRGGQSVPSSFPRLEEFIKRGWIKEVDDSEAKIILPKPKEVPKVEEVSIEPDVETQPVVEMVIEETKVIEEVPVSEPELTFNEDEFKRISVNAELGKIELNTLEFLDDKKLDILKDNGFTTFLDVNEKAGNVDALTKLYGIGHLTASKVLKSVEEAAKSFNKNKPD